MLRPGAAVAVAPNSEQLQMCSFCRQQLGSREMHYSFANHPLCSQQRCLSFAHLVINAPSHHQNTCCSAPLLLLPQLGLGLLALVPEVAALCPNPEKQSHLMSAHMTFLDSPTANDVQRLGGGWVPPEAALAAARQAEESKCWGCPRCVCPDRRHWGLVFDGVRAPRAAGQGREGSHGGPGGSRWGGRTANRASAGATFMCSSRAAESVKQEQEWLPFGMSLIFAHLRAVAALP